MKEFVECSEVEDMGFSKGFLIGVCLSLPLWLSFIGWIQILTRIIGI